MARKQTKVSRRMLFTWFMLTGIIFLFAPQNLTDKFQLAFVHVFRWPLSIGGNLALTARTQQPIAGTVGRNEIKNRNYLATLEETLDREREKFKKLYGLYNTYVWEGTNFALADVITATVEGTRNELTIACRKTNGLAKGQFVLGDNSIIGTVSDVSSSTASVKLFTDPTSRIAVKIGKLDIKKWMQGNGNNTAKIPLVSIEHQIKKGDNVFARKNAGFLDAPVIVGRVAQLKRDDKDPLFWDITVEPACDIEQLEDVAIIIMNPQK
jgi:rod shape-determining protein MreC